MQIEQKHREATVEIINLLQETCTSINDVFITIDFITTSMIEAYIERIVEELEKGGY